MTRAASVTAAARTSPLRATLTPVKAPGWAASAAPRDPAAAIATTVSNQNDRNGRRALCVVSDALGMGSHLAEMRHRLGEGHQDGENHDDEQDQQGDPHRDRSVSPGAVGVAVHEGEGDEEEEQGAAAVGDPGQAPPVLQGEHPPEVPRRPGDLDALDRLGSDCGRYQNGEDGQYEPVKNTRIRCRAAVTYMACAAQKCRPRTKRIPHTSVTRSRTDWLADSGTGE